MTPTLQALAVFLASFALDYVWTKYIDEVGNKRPHHAATWSACMIPLAAVSVVSYTTHLWLILPAVAGAYLSTWLAVRRARSKSL